MPRHCRHPFSDPPIERRLIAPSFFVHVDGITDCDPRRTAAIELERFGDPEESCSRRHRTRCVLGTAQRLRRAARRPRSVALGAARAAASRRRVAATSTPERRSSSRQMTKLRSWPSSRALPTSSERAVSPSGAGRRPVVGTSRCAGRQVDSPHRHASSAAAATGSGNPLVTHHPDGDASAVSKASRVIAALHICAAFICLVTDPRSPLASSRSASTAARAVSGPAANADTAMRESSSRNASCTTTNCEPARAGASTAYATCSPVHAPTAAAPP